MRGSGYSICQTFADASVMAKQASQQRGEMSLRPACTIGEQGARHQQADQHLPLPYERLSAKQPSPVSRLSCRRTARPISARTEAVVCLGAHDCMLRNHAAGCWWSGKATQQCRAPAQSWRPCQMGMQSLSGALHTSLYMSPPKPRYGNSVWFTKGMGMVVSGACPVSLQPRLN